MQPLPRGDLVTDGIHETELALLEFQYRGIAGAARPQAAQLGLADSSGSLAGNAGNHRFQRHFERQKRGHDAEQVVHHAIRRRAVDIGTQCIRPELLRHRGARHVEVEMHPRVPHVQHNPAFSCLAHPFAYPPVAVQHVVRIAVEDVRGNVPRMHVLKQMCQRHRRAADVHHHPRLCGVGYLARHLEGGQSVGLARGPVVDAHLHAQCLLRIFANALNGLVGLGESEILQFTDTRRERCQSGCAQVHKGIQPGTRIAHDVIAEGRVVAPPGTAGIHRRGHPRRQAGHIGIHRTRPPAVVEMPVDIQEARRNQMAPHVNHLGGLTHRNIRLDGRHPALPEGHVTALPQVLRGVENVAVLEEQIVRLSHVRFPCK